MSIIQNPIVLRRWVLALGITLGSIAAAGCSSGGDDSTATTSGGGGGGGSSSGDVTYDVTGIQYNDVSAPAGATIDINNTSGAGHTFTSDQSGLFDVPYGSGETAKVKVPSEPGTYKFHCSIHSSMTATLTVQ